MTEIYDRSILGKMRGVMERTQKILQYLSEDSYITSAKLAELLHVSSKTIRNDVEQLNEQLRKAGAFVESKAHYGMILRITDRTLYQNVLGNSLNEVNEQGERTEEIMEYLLNIEDTITMDDLADLFYISRSSLKNDMKKIREIFAQYHIMIDARANQGLKVIGHEKDVRKCLTYLQRRHNHGKPIFQKSEVARIRQIIEACAHQNTYDISDYAVSNLALHIYISIERISSGRYIELDHSIEDQLYDANDYDFLIDIVKKIEEEYRLKFSRTEIGYLLLQLIGKKSVNKNAKVKNTVISDEVYKTVTEMLINVYHVFKIDLRYDFELITALSLHLAPLEMRIDHDIMIQDIITEDIRPHTALAYNMAVVACEILEKKHHAKLSVDEVTFIALHLYVALERKQNKTNENILIVCGSGAASSKLLMYQVKERLGNRLNIIGAVSRHELQDYDFSQVNYILTTVNIDFAVPVPIIMTSTFFEDNEIHRVEKEILDKKTDRIVQRFFKEDLIFWGNFKTKEEVLTFICEKARERREVPEDFCASVFAREEIGRTSFGSLISIAHPMHPMGDESFVGLVILPKSIDWDGEAAQLIFLLSMRENGDRSMQDFYKIMGKLIGHTDIVKALTKTTNYREVLDILKKLS